MIQIDRTSTLYHPLEKETPAASQKRKWQQIQRLIQSAVHKSSEFQERLAVAGKDSADFKDPSDYSAIPTLRKKDLIHIQSHHGIKDLLTCDLGQLRRLYQSPGPLFDPEGITKDYWGWTEAFFFFFFRPDDLVQMTFSYHLTPAGHMLEEPLQEIGCCVIPAGPGNTGKQIELLTNLPVTGFVGMASYLKNIGEQALAQGLDLEKDTVEKPVHTVLKNAFGFGGHNASVFFSKG